MKYTVTINEKSKSSTVDLDGYKGTAKCCPTDSFNITTGIELALERAKVAKANAEKPTAKPMGVMELVKALEKALPKGQVVVVGNGDGLTAEQKRWLHNLTDCKGGCSCECYTDEDIEDIKADAYDEGYEDGINDADDRYDEGYNDGYDEGYEDALDEVEENTLTEDEVDELTDTIRNLIEEALGV